MNRYIQRFVCFVTLSHIPRHCIIHRDRSTGDWNWRCIYCGKVIP